MFKVSAEHKFWWPVKIKMPDPDKPGRQIVETFNMQFRAISPDKAKDLETRAAADGLDVVERGISSILEVAVDWSDVVDDDKSPIPFSVETLTNSLRYPWVRDGIINAYTEAVSGQKARLGN